MAFSREAAAQCSSGSALSEVRAARWLIGDDLLANTTLDHGRFTEPVADEVPKLRALTFGGISAQGIGSTVCTNRGAERGSMQRMRIWGGVGLSHPPTGLELRFSVLHGRDSLNVDLEPQKKNSAEAVAGYSQTMFALRFGHERWLRGMVGIVDPDAGFRRAPEGLTIEAPLGTSQSAPSTYLGASIPQLGLHLMSLFRSGQVEVVNLASQEQRLGTLPLAIAFFPTYLREERRVFATARVHLLSARPLESLDRVSKGKRTTMADAESTAGFLAEGSLEARDARLRHARVRYTTGIAGRDDGVWLSANAYAEATVFRSAFFSNSKVLGTDTPRGTAWGAGAGADCFVQSRTIGLSFQVNAAWNRPELLQILPSVQDQFEVRFVFGVRGETS